jgi:hypothetical protein
MTVMGCLSRLYLWLAIASVGCKNTAQEAKTPAEVSQPSGPGMLSAPDLVLEVSAPAQVEAGKPVLMELVVRNAGTQPLYLGTGDSTTTFDFLVADEAGRVLWNRMYDREALLILIERTLAPGQEIRFADVWHQQTNDGSKIRPGTYQVRATLDTSAPEDLSTARRTLVVRGPPGK